MSRTAHLRDIRPALLLGDHTPRQMLTSGSSERHVWLGACLALSILLGASSVLAANPAGDPPEAAPSQIAVVPELALTASPEVLMTPEVGAALQWRMSRLSVGLHVAHAPIVIPSFGGDQACSTTFCVNTRTRFGLNLEAHFRARRTIQPWLGVDVEAVTTKGVPCDEEDCASNEERRWGLLVTPKGGVDFVAHGPDGYGSVGFGLFVGIPIGSVEGQSHSGLMAGARIPIG